MADSATHSSAALFDAGNYAEVARAGPVADWRTQAARALLRCGDAALGASDVPEARFWWAAGLWLGGDEDGAARVLERLAEPAAARLLALIRKPRIDVLAQLPWKGSTAWDLAAGAASESRFRVRRVGIAEGDVPVRPYFDVAACFDAAAPPDLYFCQMLEWHLLPGDLAPLPCPAFAQTGDWDLHVQAVQPWLGAFDELLVTDPTEWRDVSRLAPVPVSTFPKSFAIDALALPALPTAPRAHDVLQSGTLLHPYHPDKAALLRQVLGLGDVRIALLDGFAAAADYLRLLGDCRLTYTHIRHPGAMPTRALEALAMGCCVLVQEPCVLRLFFGEEHGVVGYGGQPGALAAAIRRVLADWPRFERAARAGAARLRREFARERVAVEYLRYLCVRAALCGARRRGPTPALQKRGVIWRGWVPSGAPAALLDAQHHETTARLRAAAPCARVALDLARELLLRHARLLSESGGYGGDAEALAEALAVLRRGADRYPDSPVVLFDAVRACLHYGSPGDVAWALERGERALRREPTAWRVDPLEDVLPWDFAGTLFNYRSYLDLVNGALAAEGAADGELVRLLRAGLAHYLGNWGDHLESLLEARRLDPEFPTYALSLALAWLRRDEAERALPLLAELAGGSLLLETHALLTELAQRGGAAPAPLVALERALAGVRLRQFEGGPLDSDARIAPGRLDPLLAPAPPGASAAPGGACAVSVLVLGEPGDEAEIVAARRALAAQTLGAALEVLVVCAGEGETLWGAAARAARRACGEFLIALHPRDRLRADALERLVVALRARPEFGGAYADALVSEAPFDAFDALAEPEPAPRPAFDPFAEAAEFRIGPSLLWRRRAYEAAGGWAELDWHGEWELCLRASLRERWLHLREPLCALREAAERAWRRPESRRVPDRKAVHERAQALRAAVRAERRQRLIPQRPAAGALLLLCAAPEQLAAAETWLARAAHALAGQGDVAVRVVLRGPPAAGGPPLEPAPQSLAQSLATRGIWDYERVAVWPLELAPELAAQRLAELAADARLGALYEAAPDGAAPRFAVLRAAAVFACAGLEPELPLAAAWSALLRRMERRGLAVRMLPAPRAAPEPAARAAAAREPRRAASPPARERVNWRGAPCTDPMGRVFERGGRFFRAIHRGREAGVRELFARGVVGALCERGLLAPTRIADCVLAGHELVLETEAAPFDVPCERFSRGALHAAALAWLDAALALVGSGYALGDAHFGNFMLFGANRPLLVDLGALRRADELPPERPFVSCARFCTQLFAPLAALLREPGLARAARLAIADAPANGPLFPPHDGPLELAALAPGRGTGALAPLGALADAPDAETALRRLRDFVSSLRPEPPALELAPPATPLAGPLAERLAAPASASVVCVGAESYLAHRGALRACRTLVIDAREPVLDALDRSLRADAADPRVALFYGTPINRQFPAERLRGERVLALEPFECLGHASAVMFENIAGALAALARREAWLSVSEPLLAPAVAALEQSFRRVAVRAAGGAAGARVFALRCEVGA